MHFSQTLLTFAFASATMAAPAIDPRDINVAAPAIERRDSTTVVGTISNILASLQTTGGIASSALTSAANATANSVQISVQYANLVNTLKSGVSNITNTIPTTAAALKTQIGGLTQAEISQLNSTIAALQTTITGLGSSVNSSIQGIQGATAAFAMGQISTIQTQLQSLINPITAYAQSVTKYASTGIVTSGLANTTSALQDALNGQVKLLGLGAAAFPTATTSIPTAASLASIVAKLPLASFLSSLPLSMLPKLPKFP